MSPANRAVSDVETLFADAWEAHNRAEIAAILRADEPAQVDSAVQRARLALAAATDALGELSDHGLDEDDRRALTAMREALGLLATDDASLSYAVEAAGDTLDSRHPRAVLDDDGLAALRHRTAAAYGRAAEAIGLGNGSTVDRLSVLSRLATERDPGTRRELFLALEPLWRTVDADGGPDSPFRVGLGPSSEAWRRDGSPVDANARALGVDPADVEPWLRAILETWREVAVAQPVEPWDERFLTGGFSRAVDGRLSMAELQRIDRATYASLGADPVALGIRYDIAARSGRGPVPVAFMLDVDIPRFVSGRWTAGEQWVIATYAEPTIPDLGELLHESGHAIHYRAIRTRPAFAVLPDAMTTFVEALGDLVAWNLHEPAWQGQFLGRTVPLEVGLRARYGEVVRDVAWALFEILLYAQPDRSPNAVWTEITSSYLGIVPHPEWSWWAIRGQLVQSPGYMVNYGLGAIVTADLRARLGELRGDWFGGDPGWYDAVSSAVYRWGAEREPAAVLEAFLGRPISPDAILADLRQIAQSSR